MTGFKSIVVPLDFGESSEQALETAIELTRKLGTSLTLLHVYEIPAYAYGGMNFVATDLVGPIQEAARKQLEQTLADVRKRVPEARALLRRGVPWSEILAGVEETRGDLVVIGTHGRRGLSHALLGSVAERVVRTSPVPVLVVRRPSPR
jgi:nucleotide-binding universal stress UspA family protein